MHAVAVVLLAAICAQLEEGTVAGCPRGDQGCEAMMIAVKLMKSKSAGALEELLIEHADVLQTEGKQMIDRFIRVLTTEGHRYADT